MFKARRIVDTEEKQTLSEKYLRGALAYYDKEVEVTELLGIALADARDKTRMVAPFDAMKTLRTCANCGAREDSGTKMKKCAGCGMAYYCSRTCQKIGWAQGHKEKCHRIGKCDCCDCQIIRKPESKPEPETKPKDKEEPSNSNS